MSFIGIGVGAAAGAATIGGTAAIVGGAVLGGGASLYNQNKQQKANQAAVNAQTQATEQDIAQQNAALQEFYARTDPFSNFARDQSMGALPGLISDPGISDLSRFSQGQIPQLGGSEVLQNPLFKSISDDVTQRVMGNRAARGKLGSGGTASELQSQLAPQALQMSMRAQEQEIERQNLNRNLGLGEVDLQNQLRQQQFSNMFNLFTTGANVSAGQGSAGLNTSQGVSGALQAGGQAIAQGQFNNAARSQSNFNSLVGMAGYAAGGGFGGGGGRPIIQGGVAHGPTNYLGNF